MNILLGRKVRQSTPETPAPKGSPGGRPRGERGEVAVVQPKAWGTERSLYPRLPDALWNWLGSVYAESFRAAAKLLSDAYEQNIGNQLLSLVEHAIPESAYKLGRGIVEGLLQQERGFHGSKLADSAGVVLQYEGDRARSILTKLGPVEVRRAYYLGDDGDEKRAFFPLDVLLGIDGVHGMMPSVQEAVALLGSKTSYPDAVSVVERLMPFSTSLRTVERVTRSVARDLVEFQDADVAKQLSSRSTLVGQVTGAAVALLAVDGGMCRMRSKEEQFREFKMGVLGRLDKDDVKSKLYFAHFGPPDKIFDHLATGYFQAGLDKADLLHVVADGAAWIWNRVTELQQAGQKLSCVLDFYHAKERLSGLTNLLFGQSTQRAQVELDALIMWLLEGNLDLFFGRMESWKNQADPVLREAVRVDLGYFENHRHLLRYAECKASNLPIGSGIIEGAVRFVGKDRLDRTGMRWSEEGAELVLQLRCADASQRWDAFTKRRAERRKQKYFAEKLRWGLAA